MQADLSFSVNLGLLACCDARLTLVGVRAERYLLGAAGVCLSMLRQSWKLVGQQIALLAGDAAFKLNRLQLSPSPAETPPRLHPAPRS